MRVFYIVFICILFFGVTIPNAQSFTDGMSATDIIGQYTENDGITPDYTRGNTNDTPGLYGLSNASYGNAIDLVNHRLFIADTGNHRVLVFNLNSSNQLIDKTPDNVLGQPNFYSDASAVTQAGMSSPSGLAYDSTNQRLFVSGGGNRVTVYDVTSITNGEDAINVLGQTTFTGSGSANTQAGMNAPRGIAYDSVNQRLFVAQAFNHRVTVYNVASITNGENAINVLGQTTFTGAASANTQGGVNSPRALAYDSVNQKLFVSQSGNHRVTVYDVVSITDGENAVSVLGQTTFTGASSATTQAGMNSPYGLAYDSANQRLFVSQVGNNRVTIYDVTSITNGENATNVLGQATFTDGNFATTQAGMSFPYGLVYDSSNQRLFVAQYDSNSITAYDVTSITNGENAVDIIGQYTDGGSTTPDYTGSSINNVPGPYGLASASYGNAIDLVNHRLFIADSDNHRVLVFNLNSSNQLIDKTPDNVLGQTTFYTKIATTTQGGMYTPTGLAYDSANQRLFVAQGGNNRVTIYDVASITNGENAINVLGQINFTQDFSAATQDGMSFPTGLAYDSENQRLFASQGSGHRVMVYDVTSVTNGENAVNILGQSSFIDDPLPNDTQAGMNSPYGLAYDGTNQRLFVAQSGNHRVTAYDVASITDGEDAINVLGQESFIDSNQADSQEGMNSPYGLAYDDANQRLFVSQVGNHRVTIYDVTSITDGESAINVLGQGTFTDMNPLTSQEGMDSPYGLVYDSSNQKLFVAQGGNNRITVFGVHLITAEFSTSTLSSTNEWTVGNFPKLLVNGVSTATSTIQLDITGGTATNNIDYTSADPITITIPPGTYDGTLSTAITITSPTLLQDSVVESGGETVVFELINPDNVVIGDADLDDTTQTTFTYIITDSEVVVTVNTPTVIGPIGGSSSGPSQIPESLRQPTWIPPVLVQQSQTPSTPPLKLNTKGDDVKELQKFLNSQGFPVAKKGPGSKGKETALFGPATKAAVGKFQLKYKIVTSVKDPGYGVVGPKTKAKMNDVIKKDMKQ